MMENARLRLQTPNYILLCFITQAAAGKFVRHDIALSMTDKQWGSYYLLLSLGLSVGIYVLSCSHHWL